MDGGIVWNLQVRSSGVTSLTDLSQVLSSGPAAEAASAGALYWAALHEAMTTADTKASAKRNLILSLLRKRNAVRPRHNRRLLCAPHTWSLFDSIIGRASRRGSLGGGLVLCGSTLGDPSCRHKKECKHEPHFVVASQGERGLPSSSQTALMCPAHLISIWFHNFIPLCHQRNRIYTCEKLDFYSLCASTGERKYVVDNDRPIFFFLYLSVLSVDLCGKQTRQSKWLQSWVVLLMKIGTHCSFQCYPLPILTPYP